MSAGPVLRDAGVELLADPSRVVAKTFLPGDGPDRTRARAADTLDRVLALPAAEVAAAAAAILADFGSRHAGLAELLARHAATASFLAGGDAAPELSADQTVVVGAAFTMEYAVEGAALCNPTAVAHPDQGGLAAGELRVAVGLRGIGEGHVSSIGFATAVVGGGGWRFEERVSPLAGATTEEGEWSREAFRAAVRASLSSGGRLSEAAAAVVSLLPSPFTVDEVEQAIARLPAALAGRPDVRRELDAIRGLARSAYRAEFDPATDLSQRVLLPYAAEESHGMEDARFVVVVEPDGSREYRATYTAYDGHAIAPRLITTADLRRFAVHRLSGAAAVNKGMALFPRRIGGDLVALTRTDGETVSVARSADGLVWQGDTVVYGPGPLWSVVQTGNCGSPIETDRGWLVPVHGVGPMRVYSIGMLLLDLDDPTRVVAELAQPLVHPAGPLREGYVPNVVYSCGAIVHAGVLWLPYGVGDARIRVGSVGLDALLDAMTPVDPSS